VAISYAERPASSHLGVQNLGQSDAGMSKNFDRLLYPHLLNSLISMVEHRRRVRKQTCSLRRKADHRRDSHQLPAFGNPCRKR
jgi:hypothetical protein